MPALQDTFSVSIPASPPPANLNTYQRSMHQHTKRQMERANRSSVSSNMTNGSISPSDSQ
ncbi:hypothetical protein ACHAQH_007723 [Verticillium albo-atrum]